MISKKEAIAGFILLVHNIIYLYILPVLIATSIEDPQQPGEGIGFLGTVTLPIFLINVFLNAFLLMNFEKKKAIYTGLIIYIIIIVRIISILIYLRVL